MTTASSCGEAPAAGDYVLDEVPEGNVGNPGTEVRRIAVDQLPVFTSADGGSTTCSTATVDQTMRVCGFTQSASLTNICDIDVKVSTAPKIRFDTRPPPKPTISAVIPRDSALGVTVSAESDSTVRVVALLTDGDGGVGAEVASDETTATGTAELADLQNGVTYQVLAYATDQSKNTSEASDPSTGTPVASRGFFGTYVDAGGAERGGCGVAGGSLAGGAALAILGIWLSRRKQS
ncbi:hypothetical protein K8638_11195 [Myxococcus sp. RHST-1-4]|nr:MXAN_2561 family MXYO-CTERM-anchored protein [Myxococcus sp. RHSTA-1-4]MBZ4417052.1 hypothetical protein [Myxococcus sp. RHSTA-1-4]